MNKIHFIKSIIPGFILSLTITGCNKFLDTTPPLQVSPQAVLSSEQGFQQNLNAVYLEMGTTGLYGRELTMGLLSVLGRSYDTTLLPAVGNLYYQGAAYNFRTRP